MLRTSYFPLQYYFEIKHYRYENNETDFHWMKLWIVKKSLRVSAMNNTK